MRYKAMSRFHVVGIPKGCQHETPNDGVLRQFRADVTSVGVAIVCILQQTSAGGCLRKIAFTRALSMRPDANLAKVLIQRASRDSCTRLCHKTRTRRPHKTPAQDFPTRLRTRPSAQDQALWPQGFFSATLSICMPGKCGMPFDTINTAVMWVEWGTPIMTPRTQTAT